jgi:hypothetical protein
LPTAEPQVAELIRKQLALWNAPLHFAGDAAAVQRAKLSYQSTPPASDGLARTFYAAALLEAGKTDDAKRLVVQWPLPEATGDPVLQPFLYPQFLALREKLK